MAAKKKRAAKRKPAATYDDPFRRSVVHAYLNRGDRTGEEVAAQHGVAAAQIFQWIRRFGMQDKLGGGVSLANDSPRTNGAARHASSPRRNGALPEARVVLEYACPHCSKPFALPTSAMDRTARV